MFWREAGCSARSSIALDACRLALDMCVRGGASSIAGPTRTTAYDVLARSRLSCTVEHSVGCVQVGVGHVRPLRCLVVGNIDIAGARTLKLVAVMLDRFTQQNETAYDVLARSRLSCTAGVGHVRPLRCLVVGNIDIAGARTLKLVAVMLDRFTQQNETAYDVLARSRLSCTAGAGHVRPRWCLVVSNIDIAGARTLKLVANPAEISSKVTSRRYLSSIVIDDNLRQTLTTNQRPEMMTKDAASFGTTIERIVHPVASPSVDNLQTAVESGSCEGHRSTVTESSGIMVNTRPGNEPSHRRVRSMSQSLLERAKDVEAAFTREELVRSQRSIVKTLEEENEGFICDEEVQIRTVQNDGHFNNHRLSKLSIHTNNDEFFYVGGHPPSDGRTSLRSRGSMSRQSMQSTDFLAGSFAANNEWADTLQTAASRQSLKSNQIESDVAYTGEDDEVFEDAAQAKEVAEQQPVPKIRINGRSLSGSSMTNSVYVTAQERLTSPDGGGEVLDVMSPVHHERSSEYGVHGTVESECVTADRYTSSTHTSDLVSDHIPGAHSVSCHTAEEPIRSRSNLHGSSCMYDECDQEIVRNYEHSGSHDVDTKTARMSTSSLHTACDQYDRSAHSASHHNIHSSACNVAYEEAPQQTHMSNASLPASTAMLDRTGQSASRQNIRWSTSNVDVAYDEAPQRTHMSNAGLHASTAMLDRTGQSASRQNIRWSTSNVDVAYDEAPQRTHMSNASLHASNAMLDRAGQSASRQNIRSSTSNVDVAYDEAPQQTHMSNASLHASNAMLDRAGQSASRQNIYVKIQTIAWYDIERTRASWSRPTSGCTGRSGLS
ncbi:hypothetical protein ANCDUO_13267 [Ancylostoma duodenale]|uniref:Uncharacterized protein n=1 Tax=Ancylostoma duodenale TaxID=51022 RepID=A0A0C2D3A4_9BILA|nr:hypothetical protein ANCDUO_13267 [Ancylostoma duodenale]